MARAFGESPLPELARSAKLSVERGSRNERLQELMDPWASSWWFRSSRPPMPAW